MTHGGYRGDHDEWPPPRPARPSRDDRYDPRSGVRRLVTAPGALRTTTAAEPRTAVPSGERPVDGQRPAAPRTVARAAVVRALPGRVRRRGGRHRARATASRRLRTVTAIRRRRPCRLVRHPPRDVPRGRPADLRPLTPDGRPRRFARTGSPIAGQPARPVNGRRSPAPARDAGPTSAVGQMPTSGPARQRPASSAGRTSARRQTPRPPAEQPRRTRPRAAAGRTGQPPTFDRAARHRQPYRGSTTPTPRATGSRPRYYDADRARTGSRPRPLRRRPRARTRPAGTAALRRRPAPTGGLSRVPADQPPRRPGCVAIGVIASLVVLAALRPRRGYPASPRRPDRPTRPAPTPAPRPSIDTAAISDLRRRPGAAHDGRGVPDRGRSPSTSPIAPYTDHHGPRPPQSCRTAATAAIGTLLASVGCNQVVRATMLRRTSDVRDHRRRVQPARTRRPRPRSRVHLAAGRSPRAPGA